MFNIRIVTQTANHLESDAETTKGNRKHALSTYKEYDMRMKLSRYETKV